VLFDLGPAVLNGVEVVGVGGQKDQTDVQYVHRRVSDELLALEAIAWNLSERREGRLRGKRPYDELGVDVDPANDAWYDVVLNAECAAA
jgi:hypothetical protein